MFEIINEQHILEKINDHLYFDYQSFYSISINDNKSPIKSIVVSYPGSVYHEPIKNVLFAKIKTNGKKPFISFNAKYGGLFDAVNIPYYSLKSEVGFFRIDLYVFYDILDNSYNLIQAIMKTIFNDLFSFSPFGCCSRFEKCSDNKKCLHPDLVYSTACQYGKNLASGKIFYGKNRNI